MPTGDVVFGIPELDGNLAPYLPPGWLAVLLGDSGAGTSLIAKQFAFAGVGSCPVTYYTTYERTEDVHHAFEEYGWDPAGIQITNLAEQYYTNVLERELEISRHRVAGLKLSDVESTTRAPERRRSFNLTDRVLADLAGLDGRFRIALDSIDFLLEVLEPSRVLDVARHIRYRAQTLGGHAVLVLQSGIHDRRTTGLLEDLADLVIELSSDRLEEGGASWIEIRKLRNHPERRRRDRSTVGDRGFELVADTRDAKGRRG